jgi:hypothetical protein
VATTSLNCAQIVAASCAHFERNQAHQRMGILNLEQPPKHIVPLMASQPQHRGEGRASAVIRPLPISAFASRRHLSRSCSSCSTAAASVPINNNRIAGPTDTR